MADNNNKKITLFQLIALSIAFFGAIRNVPTVASVGWESIFYMICAGIFFAIPISLISAELATGWPQEGGLQVWIKAALGERWSFVASWMLWIIMIIGMVMVSSAGASVFAYGIGRPDLSQNPIFITIVTIVAFWCVTLINFKASLGKKANTIASVIGIYIPFTLFIVLGIWFAIKHGNVNLGAFNVSTALPDIANISHLAFFAAICFIFSGLEQSAVYANEIENTKRNYPLGILTAIALVIVFNLFAGLTEANAIPANKIDLATVVQPFQLYFNELGIPWATTVISIMVYLGVLAQLSAWVLGPSKEMIKVAEDGDLPKFFQKRNKDGIPVTFVMIQAIAISILSLLYLVVPAINTGYFMVLILTTILYSAVYVILLISAVVLKYKCPEVKRPFTVPGGKVGMWITASLGMFGVITTIVVSFIPSNEVPKGDGGKFILFQALGLIITFVVPLIIYRFKKPEWKKEVQVLGITNNQLNNIVQNKVNDNKNINSKSNNNNHINLGTFKHATIHHK
ncbi:amino acid permease [Clostridium tarantellae]|uniref:Amino acid permease n=1 Tax=Clostridium tarantellae TaxID=39493 RepID=A0A6I1MK83_9CLOT|nr:amino acid permease [Clostridium tarantellae]MPQ42557.1 amino acid permease [Clostridium tarantellae]